MNSWGSRTKSRYKGLQFALNRPFRNGLMLKGAYTLSQAKDMTTNGEDGWVGLTWNHPLKYDDNFDLAVFDRTHIAQLGFLYELPFFKESKGALHAILGGWQVNGIAAWYSGTPYSIAGTNTALNCQGCGSILINYAGDKAEPVGSVGSGTETYYDKSLFSQPTGTDYAGFGNTGRTFFRRPNVWNVDLSLFKAFQIGRVRPEIRIEAANVFNHPNWGARSRPTPRTTSCSSLRPRRTAAAVPRPARPTRRDRGSSRSACVSSSSAASPARVRAG